MLCSFIDEFEDGNGWILKAPFVQNRVGFPVRYYDKEGAADIILRQLENIHTKSSTSFNKIGIFIIFILFQLNLQHYTYTYIRTSNVNSIPISNPSAAYENQRWKQGNYIYIYKYRFVFTFLNVLKPLYRWYCIMDAHSTFVQRT